MNSVIMCGPGPTTFSNLPPIIVEEDVYCKDCGTNHEMEKCPLCGSWVDFNIGLGAHHQFCRNSECDWRFMLGCGGNFIEEYFISDEQYRESEFFPIHCNAHNRDAWICFNGE